MKPSKNKKPKTIEPNMPWQNGKYSRLLVWRSIIPYPFLLLCKLLQVSPEQMISDFMNNLAYGSPKQEGTEAAKSLLADYILAMRYGQQQYTEQDIKTMFKELDALGILFPADNPKLLELYVNWREEHFKYWFYKWYHEYKRNDADIT